jgi:SNF2 family DNA or RNA helicase
MPHSPLDVFGQWRFLDPTAFGTKQADGSRRTATFPMFRGRYAVMGGYMGHEVKGYVNLDHMKAIMAERAFAVTKADALDLPPTTDAVVPVTLSPAEQTAYAGMKANLAAALTAGNLATAPNRLAQMMRLRQITSGHLPDDNGALHVIGDAKARTIASLVNDTLAGETRVVVFCFFTHEVHALQAALATSGTVVQTIDGGTPSAERQVIRARFGSDDPTRLVLVAQIRTMSLAVNELVTASHAVFGSLSQQRDDYEQARARLDRSGQKRPVTFWNVVAPGTIDEVILRSHQERTDLERAVIRHLREGVTP